MIPGRRTIQLLLIAGIFSTSHIRCQNPSSSISGAGYIRRFGDDHQKHISIQGSSYQNRPQEGPYVVATTQPTTVSSPGDTIPAGPCSTSYCTNETLVNCSGLALTGVNSTWFPRNTTVILLDNNLLTVINNSSFCHLSDLRVLSLSLNKIKRIESGSFSGLVNLEVLNLENNHLSETVSYPTGVFDSLSRLTDLRLRHNQVDSDIAQESLKSLRNLRSLTLDAAGAIFSLKNTFLNLTTFVLSGKVKNLDENSFENAQNLTVLKVDDLPSLSNFTDTALGPLCHLEILVFKGAFIGLTKSLHILKPLTGRNMTAISFERLSFSSHESYSSLNNNDSILDLSKTQYLIQICVKHVSLTGNRIFVIKADAVSSPVWNRCLRTLDLSNNLLFGEPFILLSILKIKHIEIFTMVGSMQPCYRKGTNGVQQTEVLPPGKCDHMMWPVNSEEFSFGNNLFNKAKDNTFLGGNDLLQESIVQGKDDSNRAVCSSLTPFLDTSKYFTIYISKTLQYLKMSKSFSHNNFNRNILFVGAESLFQVDLRDNQLNSFQGKLLGLDALQAFLLSGNDASILSEAFFDGMCNLEYLELFNCQLNSDFMSKRSDRVFHNLHRLKRLDLSFNLLHSLSHGTFASNVMLEDLDLSQNRFRKIPFNLESTPNLKRLDLRDNSIASIEPDEREKLDKLAKQTGGFSLLLSGNDLSCECGHLKFLHWLATTRVQLYDLHNLTCMNKDGDTFSWNIFDAEFDKFWRECLGHTFLILSLILFFFMSLGFISVFVTWKNQIFIKSKLLQLLTGLKVKRQSDYRTGVFIGYSDRDYTFPCFVLRKYIEDGLKMTTFISHRDMEPCCLLAGSIVNAINASWRIVLVFSKNFLFNDEWSMFTVSSAIYALSPENPARVVVLVHEDLLHRLPAEVLNTVSEENIIVVPSWEMSYDLREKLRTRLDKS